MQFYKKGNSEGAVMGGEDGDDIFSFGKFVKFKVPVGHPDGEAH